MLCLPDPLDGRSESRTMQTKSPLLALAVASLLAMNSLSAAGDAAVLRRPGATLPDPAMPRVRANSPGGGLHYDVPCRVSSVGRCITEPPQYPPYGPRP